MIDLDPELLTAHEARFRAPHVSLEVAERVVGEAREGGDLARLARALLVAGQAWSELLHLPEADAALTQAHTLFAALREPGGALWAAADLGYVRLEQGRHPEARDHFQDALDAAETQGNLAAQGYVHNALGSLYADLEWLPRAAHHYREAAERREELGDTAGQASVLANLGNLHLRLGDFEAALQQYGEARRLFGEAGEARLEVAARLNVALALLELGRHDEARAHYGVVLDASRAFALPTTEIRALEHLAHLDRLAGDVQMAETRAREAVRVAERLDVPAIRASAALQLAEVRLARGGADAADLFARALALARGASLDEPQIEAHDGLGRAHAAAGDFEAAFHAMHTARRGQQDLDRARSAPGARGALVEVEVEARRREVRRERERGAALERALAQLEAAQAENRHLIEALRQRSETWHEAAHHDPLTNLANRRAFDDALAAAPLGEALSLVLIDVDHFKRVNDTFGHAAGDGVLRELAGVLREVCPPGTLAARLGGEEFALVCPGVPTAGAGRLAERVRLAVRARVWSNLPPGSTVTVSCGVAGTEGGAGARPLLPEADRRLYRAKATGRDRVEADG